MNLCVAAMSADPRFMSPLERVSLIVKLGEIDPSLVLGLDEEMTILFPTTLRRLNAAQWDLSAVDWPLWLRLLPPLRRFVQMSYEPIGSLQKQKLSWHHTRKNIKQLRHGI